MKRVAASHARRWRGRGAIGLALAAFLVVLPAYGEDVSFRNKTLTMVVGAGAGGGTDGAGRLIAQYLARYLPGQPSVIVRNIPGAEGVVGFNYFTQQVAPDGLTVAMGSSTLSDPMVYRKPQSKFDPTDLEIVGGLGRGGKGLIINKAAEPRLYDRSKAPVMMGALVGVPRSGMQMTAWGVEFLNWNVRWVIGYHSTPELFLALERGEVEMTSDSGPSVIAKFLNTGHFRLIAQSGGLQGGRVATRTDFGDTPILGEMLKGHIADPLQAKAFAFWNGMTMIDKWIALPAKTPAPLVESYRAAFRRLVADPQFVNAGKEMGEDFAPMTDRDVASILRS